MENKTEQGMGHNPVVTPCMALPWQNLSNTLQIPGLPSSRRLLGSCCRGQHTVTLPAGCGYKPHTSHHGLGPLPLPPPHSELHSFQEL